MSRRRLYVFGAIILVGVLIGFFCLPDSGDTETEPEDAGSQRDVSSGGPEEVRRGTLPPANIADTPAARARQLVAKARESKDARARAELLRQAYDIDPRGRWGGEAAAGLGRMWKTADKPRVARQWFVLARRAPVSAATLSEINTELRGMKARRRREVTASIKTINHKVRPNDSLWKIAKRHGTTVGALKRINNLSRDLIRVNTVLKVPKGTFDVLVSKGTHTLQLLQDDKPVKIYEVGVGDADHPTPTGTFTVKNKLPNPAWNSDNGRIPAGDPRNLLGSRWIGFEGRLGIHGCRKQDEDTIGTDCSSGCIRMHDKDVKRLYDFMVPGKSKVTITE